MRNESGLKQQSLALVSKSAFKARKCHFSWVEISFLPYLASRDRSEGAPSIVNANWWGKCQRHGGGINVVFALESSRKQCLRKRLLTVKFRAVGQPPVLWNNNWFLLLSYELRKVKSRERIKCQCLKNWIGIALSKETCANSKLRKEKKRTSRLRLHLTVWS